MSTPFPANITIQDLATVASLDGTEVFEIQRTNASSAQASITQIGSFIGAKFTTIVTLPIAVASGGSGTTVLATGLLQGNGAIPFSVVSYTTAGMFLVSAGSTAAPTWTTSISLSPQWANASAIPSGGSTSIGVMLTSAASLGIFVGSGAPTLAAATGSLYFRTDGSTATSRLYSNLDGSTGWTSFLAMG